MRRSDDEVVRCLLDLAGLEPPESDVLALIESYGRVRAMVAAIRSVPDTRYESPALVFTVTAGLADDPGGDEPREQLYT